VGSQVLGALKLADRIEDWDPEQQAKLRQVGLRSSFELDDEEGHVFIALSAEHYPLGVMGRCNAAGDLFVSRPVAFPDGDLATALNKVEQSGFELIMGSEAKELLRKMEQVKRVAPRADTFKEIWEIEFKKIWEVENWGTEEWAEQVLAEIAFAKIINVQYFPEAETHRGRVAGYCVCRASNGLVLVASDSDEDVFVAVEVGPTKRAAYVLGWLRGSEGKVSRFYQTNCWVIPPEALHNMESLPVKNSSLGERAHR